MFAAGMTATMTAARSSATFGAPLQAAAIELSPTELVASIAHEVNQPLSAMLANGRACLRWFDRDEPDLEAARQSVERMLDNATRAAGIVATLSAMARGALPERTPMSIDAVLRAAVSQVADKIEANEITVFLNLHDRLPQVRAARIELEQVFVNLLTNAVQALSGVSWRRCLTLAADVDWVERQVIVEIRDNGPGFGAAQCARVFDPFFTTKPQGMGMGLAFCRAIVSSLGGRINARTNEGGGACLVVRLSIADTADGRG